MSGYINFENRNKIISFFIKDDKYNKIWDAIKNKLGTKFHSEPVYECKYLKAKAKEFDGVIKTKFWGNNMPKENMHYTCIACITTDSVLRIDKKNHLQVYLEECKMEQKTQMSRFINTELKFDSESSDSDLERIGPKFDNELMSKLEKSGSNSE